MKVFASIRKMLGKPGSLASNILVLAGGTAMAKVIAFAAIPVLTRLYSPQDFGVLALYVTCVSFIVPLATLRYHVAIPLPRNDRVAVHILMLALLLVMFVTLLSALAIQLGGQQMFVTLAIGPLAPYGWLIVIGVAGTAVYEIFQYWSLRKRNMKAIARTQILQSLTGSGTKIAMGLASYLPLGLLVGQILQQAGSIVSLVSQYARDMRGKHPSVRLRRLFFVARRYVGFPVTRLPSQFLLVAAIQMPILLITNFFGIDMVGQYALAFSTLALPVNLIAQSVGNAYYAEIANLGINRKLEIRQLTHDVMKKLAIVAVIPVVFLVLFGPWAFSIVFGDIWRIAGVFAQIMAVYLFMQIVTAPVMHVLTVLEKNFLFLMINAVRVVLVIIIFLLAHKLNLNIIETVTAYSFVLAGYYALITITVLQLIERQVH